MISALYIHPIKSCRGIAVNAATLTEAGALGGVAVRMACAQCAPHSPACLPVLAGLRYDREWMVVQEEGGRFLSQRATPRMALVSACIPVCGRW